MKPVFVTRKPYSGLTRSLVIAIDVGTTFSGVSYAILDPGEVPQIHGVTRFPGQEHVAGNSKIPSVLYYDKKGEVKAVGAEADSAYVQATAEDEGWIKVELFKLRLRPRTMNLSMNGLRLAPLPPRKSPVHIFGDFLSYLYTCTTSFIKDTHANGSALLTHVIPHHVEFVLSHPNGWEGAQQAKMRRAAIYGRLIDDTPEGRARIRFVTEGEASLHACVLSGLATDVLSNPGRHGFLIADAGGGTLDISSYAIKGTNPLVMEEVAPPDCIFAGSVFVSRRARDFFEQKLKGCKYGTPDSLDHITRQFDEKTKRLFRDSKDTQFVPFGSPFDRDHAFGIRNGQLRLTGAEVANLFEPSIDAAFNAIKKQIEACSVSIKSVFLVGGYAASPWLHSQLQERLKAMNVSVSRPDTQTSKAVADGAIGFYCDHHVSARMSKFMYGVEYLRVLDPDDPEHVERKEKLCELPSGPKLLPDAFDCILARNLKVKESTVFSRKYCTELTSLSMLRVFEVEIWCYRGGNTVPKWIERRSETFSTLCIVKADLSMLSDSAAPKQGTNGKTYWTIVFSVEIHFGLTEFQARIKWVQNGETKYGPATIVYNERGHRSEEDEPDFYPEDDALTRSNSSRAGADRHSSRQSSRARTPTDGHFIDSSRRSSRVTSDPSIAPSANTSSIPEVSRVPSTKPASSNPATPSRSAYASLHDDKDDRRKSDRDSYRDRDRDRDRDSTRTRSNRSSLVPSAPGSPSIVPPSIPSIHSSRPRGHTPTPTPGSPALSYVDPPLAPPTPKSAALPSPPKEPASLWDNTTPTAIAPPEGAGLSRATSNASAFGTAKSISIFGEDPKSAFGTPGGGGVGVVDLLGGGDPTGNGDRPTSIFGEEITTAPAFGSPSSALPHDKGMPGGLFDEPVDNANAGGWGAPLMSSIPRSVSISSRKTSSLKGSPVVSRAPSGQGKPLSPLNPAAQQQAAVDSLAAAVAVLNDPSTSTSTTLPKINTNISPLSALSSAAPSAMGSGLTTPAAETPATPIGGASETGTPVSVTGSAKKKKKKTGTAAVAAATAKREEEEKQRKLEEEEAARKAQEEAEAAAKKAQEEAEEAERQAAAQKAQEEAEEAARKVHEEEERRKAAEAEAAAAETRRLQEEEERKRQEEEQRLKEEEEAKRRKEEEEAAKAPKKKPGSKKEERERKKKEEQERKEREKEEKARVEREEKERKENEERERRERENQERLASEENKRQEEEAQRKAEEARVEQERIAEEARKKAEEERLEQERIVEERKRIEDAERKRKEEQERLQQEADERIRKKEEELRLEEERIAKELADLEKQEQEARLQEEREREEREEEERRREERVRKEREEEEKKKQEEEARREREKRAREREERERIQKAERERLQQQSKAPSLSGFGGWGGKIASSLFGGTTPEEQPQPPTQPWLDTKQDVNESALGWGSGFGVKKKPSISSIAKSTTGPTSLSRKPSQRSFQWSNAGATTTTSAFDFAAPVNNTAASLFGSANVNFDESQGINLQDINTNPAPAAEQANNSPPPPPPPKEDENPAADPWDIAMTSTKKKGGKASEDPTRTSTPVPEATVPAASKTPEEEGAAAGGDAFDDAWDSVATKKKKGKKGKSLLDLGGSEQPTRETSPAPGTPAEDPSAAQGTTTPENEWAESTGGKKKKGKKDNAWGMEEPGTPAEAPAAEGGGAESLQDQLADLLGNDNEGEDKQAQTADAAEEWGLPVKTKKKKKKGNAVEDDGAAPSPIEAGPGGGDDGFTAAGGKKKKKKRG